MYGRGYVSGTLAVRNKAQKVLLEEELMGQLSDGQWENTNPHDHWEQWCSAKIIVDPTNVGRDFWVRKDNYRLDDPGLLDIVGHRMLAAVSEKTGNRWYSLGDMKSDLKDLKAIFRTERTRA